MTSFRLTYGLASEIGYMRTTNKDSLVARTWSNNLGFFAVAIGVGPDGKTASQLACDIVIREMNACFQDVSYSDVNNSDKVHSILKAAIQTANRQIITQTSQSGTTFTAALVIGNSLYITHVGDSRAYLISSSDTQQLTVDHTWTHELIRNGHITEEELKRATVDDVLYRALGQTEPVEVDTKLTNIIPNTWLMLCTKGLRCWHWAGVSLEEIYTTLSQNDSQLAADILVGLSSAREYHPDISAVIIKFDAVT